MSNDITGRLALVIALLAAASLWFAARRRRDGQFADAAQAVGAVARSTDMLSAEDLGQPLGERATFVQFSAATCAACPQVRRVLGDLARGTGGVTHVEIAAEERMDLVRRFGVHRTPTVLLVGPDGAVWSRASGPMDPGQATAALHAHLVPGVTHAR